MLPVKPCPPHWPNGCDCAEAPATRTASKANRESAGATMLYVSGVGCRVESTSKDRLQWS